MTLFNSDPSILNSTFLSTDADGGFNWAKWRDPGLDQLLLQAASDLDPARRVDLYRQAQTHIMDAALILPIRDYVQLNVARAEVRGLRFDRGGLVPLAVRRVARAVMWRCRPRSTKEPERILRSPRSLRSLA
jgi:ABC-type transport system substrate-binding protein